jgi:hypothetical protein
MTDIDTTTAPAPAGTPALNAALAALQSNLPEVKKTRTGSVKGVNKDGVRYDFSYKYADLADISASIMPLLGGQGLSFCARPTINGKGQFVLSYSLLHASGEALTGEYPLPSPDRVSAQAVGSAITYGRRYALCAVAGVAGEDDDDGRAAAETAPARSAQRPERRPAGPPPERAPAALPRNADGSLSRSQITDAELAAAGAMTSAQVKDHGALRNGATTGHSPPGAVTRATSGPDADDPWLQGLPPEHPLRIPTAARPARCTGGQAGWIVKHFARLGVGDDQREQRLAATATLAGIARDITSTRDLSQDEARRVSDVLSKLRDKDALLALLVAGDAPAGREGVPAPA